MKQKELTKRSLLLLFALLAFVMPEKAFGDVREAVLETNNACASISFTNSSYGWEWDSTNNRLRSTNYNVNSSTAQTTITFNTIIASTFSFDYAVSSESSCDKLTITLDGATIVNAISGTVSNTYTNVSLSAGSHTLVLKYQKDGSSYYGDDRAYVSNMKFKSNAIAYDFSSGGIYYKIHDALNRSVYVSFQSYSSGGRYTDEVWTSGYSGSVSIPSTVSYGGNSYSVKGVGAHAFDNSTVTSVTLPSTINIIKACAFTYCTNLTSVTLPSSLTTINQNAFSNCTRLTSITIPACVTSIGNYAFYGCSALASVTSLSTAPPALGTGVFSSVTYSNASLHVPSVSLSAYCSSTDWNSFTNKSTFATPNDTREAVLETNNACTSISFANSSYGWEWDSANNRLRSNNYNVHSSTAQTTITFSTVISSTFSFDYAVSSESSCDKLTITLDGTTIVNAISGTVSSTYTNVSLSAGSHTLVLKYQKDGSANSGDDRAYVSNMKFKSNATAYDFSSGGIYYKIHDALTRSVYVSFQSYSSGGRYTDEVWTSGYSGSVSIPSSVSYGGYTYSVKGVGAHAFDNSTVTSVTLPSTINIIKACAFTYCRNLTSITIPSSVTAINQNAFSNCDKLTSITIPSNVTSIGNYAFYGCTTLTSVTSNATTPPTMGTSVFSATTYSNAVLSVPTGYESTYRSSTGWSSFTNNGTPTTITIGTGTISSHNTPYYNYYCNSTTQSIYTAAEIGGAGTISAIAYYVATTGSHSTSAVRIYMGHKSSLFSSASDYLASGSLTLVYSGSPTIGTTSGWETINLTTPFVYNGTSNLVVVVCRQASNYTDTPYYWSTTMTSSSYCLQRHNDSDASSYGSITGTASYSTTTERPNIRLTKTGSSSIAPTSITMSTSSATVRVGSTCTLSATVSPSTATNKTVSWSSSNTSVATVSSSGVVTGIGKGTCYIYATTSNGITTSCYVTVKQAVTSISLSATSVTIWKGATRTITATASPSTASNTGITWTTSNSSVATVSSSGVITAVGKGTCYIYATAADGYGAQSSCYVTVQQPVTSISLNKTSATIVAGQATSLSATTSPSTANNTGVTWSTTNSSVATVTSAGTVTAVGAGSCYIRATAADGYGTQSSCTITVIGKGDVNGDGYINTADVTGSVNFILGNSTTGLYEAAADYNSNGTITTTDAISIVRLALTGSTNYTGTTTLAKQRGVANALEGQEVISVDDVIMASGASKVVALNISDMADKFTSMQFDVRLPEGVTIENVTTGNRATDHAVVTNDFGDGNVRVICYSLSNENFSNTEGDVVKLTLKSEEDILDGAYNVDLHDIMLVRGDVSIVYSADKNVPLTIADPTAIKSTSNSNALQTTYANGLLTITANDTCIVSVNSVSGIHYYKNKLSAGETVTVAVPAGIYIINGTKKVLK